jgi:hypothetical protein
MKLYFALAAISTFSLQATAAQADNAIVRPYQSIRSAGMGGVRILTGLYEENFFGNPARVTANPTWKVGLPDPTVEINSHTFSTVSDLTSNNSGISKLSDSTGNNNHGRFEMTFPSIFVPAGDLSFAVGLLESVQADADLNKDFSATTRAIADAGLSFTAGMKMLDDKSLSVGATFHALYRGASRPNTSVADVLRDPSKIFSTSDLQRGGTIDFDIGGTYLLPVKIDEIDFTVGAAIDNVFGGKYDRWAVGTVTDPNTGTLVNNPPPAQPRAIGFGLAVHQPSQWVFTDPVLALEFSDIGNNPDGSLFKTVHIGYELHYSILSPRIGINEGYWTLGLGINLHVLQIDLASYGEENTTNVGGDEDRRFAVRLAFQL